VLASAPSSAAPDASGRYARREPETTVLHRVVREHLATFLATVREERGPIAAPHFTAAFADIDGDGRTDVVLREEGADGLRTWAFLTPPVLPPHDTDLLADDASMTYVRAAKTADDAAAELARMTVRAATPAAVRRLLAQAPTAARVFYYHRKVDGTRGLIEAAPDDRRDWWQKRARCDEALGCVLRCEARRPVCRSMLMSGRTALPYREVYYWPAWNGARMELFAAAFESDWISTAF
jgi:hypothetical protein